MKTVWKFQLAIVDGPQMLQMPKGAEVLTAQLNGLSPCLWAIVDTDVEEAEVRTFEVFGTGGPMPEIDRLTKSRKYIGTVQQQPFVWHVFEIV